VVSKRTTALTLKDCVLPKQCIYKFLMILTIDSDFSLNRINHPAFLMEKKGILCKVGTQFTNVLAIS
jgi:hypothetical protein